MGDTDRLSQLPDGTLSEILSRLPPKEAVATSILSSSWKTLWKPSGEVRITFRSTTNDLESVHDIVHKMIHKRPPLLKLVLTCTLYNNDHPIRYMLRAATDCLVVELDMSIKPNKEKGVFQLPDCVLTSQRLKSLTLSGVSARVPNWRQVFTALKRLKIDISLRSDVSLQVLSSKCPTLQELILEGIIKDLPRESDKRTFEVYSLSLNTLKIRIKTEVEFGRKCHNAPDPIYTFSLDAPNLQYLVVNENILAGYEVYNLATILEANLEIGRHDVGYELTHPKSLNVFSLLQGLAKVQSLILYDQTTMAVGFIIKDLYQAVFYAAQRAGNDMYDAEEMHMNTLPIFNQLTKLSIHIPDCFGCELVMYLLDRTPALKELIIQKVERKNMVGGQEIAWTLPPVAPVCLKNSNLKIQLKGFRGEYTQIVNYFQDITRSRESSESEGGLDPME